jgi:hypothetical protein
MSERIHCDKEACEGCARIIVRVYRELRESDYSDRDAFISAVRVLELRHPGHDRWFYFRNVARALGNEPLEWPADDNGSHSDRRG